MYLLKVNSGCYVEKDPGQQQKQEDLLEVQCSNPGWDGGGLGSRGEMLDSGYILEVEPIEFTDGLQMGNERGELRDDFEVFSLKKNEVAIY